MLGCGPGSRSLEQLSQDARHQIGQILGDETRPEAPPGLGVDPDPGAGRLEGGDVLRHQPGDEPAVLGDVVRRPPDPTGALDEHLTGVGVPELEQKYEGKGYGALKTDLADVMTEWVTSFRARTQVFLDDPETLDSLLAKGAEKARASSAPTLEAMYERMGFVRAR